MRWIYEYVDIRSIRGYINSLVVDDTEVACGVCDGLKVNVHVVTFP